MSTALSEIRESHEELQVIAVDLLLTMPQPELLAMYDKIVALAKAYGFHAERIESTGDFAAAFGRALNSATGAVLDIAISPEALTPRQTLSQMRDAALASQKAKA